MIPHPPEKVMLTVNGQIVENDQVIIPLGQNDVGCAVNGGYPFPKANAFSVTVDNDPVNLKKTQSGYSGLFRFGKDHHQRQLRCSLQTKNDKLLNFSD